MHPMLRVEEPRRALLRINRFTILPVTFLLAISAQAALIYDNGAPNSSSGNEFTQWIQAEDFTLASPANIEAIRFWAFPSGGTGYAGSITWRVYNDVAGAPGAVLYSGSAAVTPVNEGPNAFGGYTQWRFDINTGTLALGAGTYWLGLHNGPLSTTARANFYWQTTGANATSAGLEDIDPFDSGGWYNNGNHHAFQLYDAALGEIPEPSTLALMGAGLAALSLFRRR